MSIKRSLLLCWSRPILGAIAIGIASLGCEVPTMVSHDAIAASDPIAAEGRLSIPPDVLRSLRARFGSSVPGMNEVAVGKLRPEPTSRGRSTSLPTR